MPSSAVMTLLLLLASHTCSCIAQDSDVISSSFAESPSSSLSSSSSSLLSSSSLSLPLEDQRFRFRLRQPSGLFQYEPADISREQGDAARIGLQHFVEPETRLPDLHSLRLRLLHAMRGRPVKRHHASGSDVARGQEKMRSRDAMIRVDKKYDYFCDLSRITIQIIFEYLRSGKICGFRVSKVRFGLGGRR